MMKLKLLLQEKDKFINKLEDDYQNLKINFDLIKNKNQ